MLLHSRLRMLTMPALGGLIIIKHFSPLGGSVARHLPAAGRRVANFAMGAALAALAACATPPTDPAALKDFEATNDPLEPMNRDIFTFNLYLDRYFIKPVAIGYSTVVPDFARTAIRNFLHNLGEPVIFANDMMQAEWQAANLTAARFLINSTFGVGGTVDFAGNTGIERQTGDFGQTLDHWGFAEGPYLVLPIFGPSNPRDAIGLGVDGAMDPYGYWVGGLYGQGAANAQTYGRLSASGVDLRARNIDTLDDLQRNAIDFYAEMRSLYRQHRAEELRHGRPGPMPNLDIEGNAP
jgi:phospholipid-binding lipoprotein MlaA